MIFTITHYSSLVRAIARIAIIALVASTAALYFAVPTVYGQGVIAFTCPLTILGESDCDGDGTPDSSDSLTTFSNAGADILLVQYLGNVLVLSPSAALQVAPNFLTGEFAVTKSAGVLKWFTKSSIVISPLGGANVLQDLTTVVMVMPAGASGINITPTAAGANVYRQEVGGTAVSIWSNVGFSGAGALTTTSASVALALPGDSDPSTPTIAEPALLTMEPIYTPSPLGTTLLGASLTNNSAQGYLAGMSNTTLVSGTYELAPGAGTLFVAVSAGNTASVLPTATGAKIDWVGTSLGLITDSSTTLTTSGMLVTQASTTGVLLLSGTSVTADNVTNGLLVTNTTTSTPTSTGKHALGVIADFTVAATGAASSGANTLLVSIPADNSSATLTVPALTPEKRKVLVSSAAIPVVASTKASAGGSLTGTIDSVWIMGGGGSDFSVDPSTNTVTNNSTSASIDLFFGTAVSVDDFGNLLNPDGALPLILGPGQTFPTSDADGDGINDDADACPFSPGFADRQGCPWGDDITVILHVIDKANSGECLGSKSCKKPVEGALVRVFDRNNSSFQSLWTKNPSGDLYDNIFETNVGVVGSCVTNNLGTCIAGEASVGEFLVIAKMTDGTTGTTIYMGKHKDEEDFDEDGLASKKLKAVKLIEKDGTVHYKDTRKTVVVMP